MEAVVHNQKNLSIIYDASLVDSPTAGYFSVDYWRSRRALANEAVGRGSAWFIDAPFGAAVLRHYLRGGWVARINRQSYFFTGVSKSRPFMEFNILSTLYEKGLPVPRPLAALCRHRGLLSRGAIITQRIPAVKTLADLLPGKETESVLNTEIWNRVGQCIRKFHQAGVRHADLNARNILLDDEFKVFLVDFDKASLTPGTAVDGKANLKRLKRSLAKLWPVEGHDMMEPAWVGLLGGYHG